jgi:F-type H+-transporting ATPase subunit b
MAAATEETVGAHEPSGLPQLDMETYPGQLFWLVITFGLLFILLSRVTLPRIAEQSKKDASDALAQYEAALAQARSKALAMADENRKRIVGEIEALKKEADAKAQDAMGKAEARIATERTRAEGNIRSAAAEAAASIVERLLGVQVSGDEAIAAVDGGKKVR